MPPEPTNSSADDNQTSPNYPGLVRLLIQPLLESPESLSVDCEQLNQNRRIWIRIAFEGEDKGRVFGRGGRNIQAMRTVLASAATLADQSVYVDIYESSSNSVRSRSDYNSEDQQDARSRSSRRPHSRKPIKPRLPKD